MRRPVGVKGIRFGICWSRCLFSAELPLSPPLYLLCFEHVDNLGAYSIPSGDRPSYPIWLRQLTHGDYASQLSLGKSSAAAGQLKWALRRWLDVLVHAEKVRRIVLLLDRSKASVIIAERSLNPFLSFVHHEVNIGAAG